MKHILFALLVIFILILCGCAQERPSFDLSPSSDSENASVNSVESEKNPCLKEPTSELPSYSVTSATTKDGLFEYEVCKGEVKILNVLRDDEELTVPAYIDGHAVTAIGEMAFYQKNNCRTLHLPQTLKTIESGAFYRCYNLQKVTIPASVTHIEKDAFFRTGALKAISVEEENGVYCDVDGVLFTLDKTTLVLYPEGKGCEEYALPSGVTAIEELAFGYYPAVKKLIASETVSFPESLSVTGTEDMEIVMQ